MSNDGRALPREALEKIRIEAVRRVRAGERPSEVISSYGLCRTSIYRWMREERCGGEGALRSRRGGGPRPVLGPGQRLEVACWIAGRHPQHDGLGPRSWTRRSLARELASRFNIALSVTSVGRLLAELGIPAHRPVAAEEGGNSPALKGWWTRTYPRLRRRARRRFAEIYFVHSRPAPADSLVITSGKGKRSISSPAAARHGHCPWALSAVSPGGAFWYDRCDQRLSGRSFRAVLEKFLGRSRRSVLLILHQHPAHTTKAVADLVHRERGRLEVWFLPGDRAGQNPEGFSWQHRETRRPGRVLTGRDVNSVLLTKGAERVYLSRDRVADLLRSAGIEMGTVGAG